MAFYDIWYLVRAKSTFHSRKQTNRTKISYFLTSPAVLALRLALAASSADLAAELVISTNAASKFLIRSAAADNLLLLLPLFLAEEDGDLDAMVVVADRLGDSDAVIFVAAGGV